MFLRCCTGLVVSTGINVANSDAINNQLIRIMENPTNPQSEHSDGQSAADETTGAQADPHPQSERPVFHSFRDAIRKGAEDARTAAEKTIPKVKSAAAGAVYWTAYGVSFAAVFQWTLAKGLAPESLKSGLHDGMKAAEEVAQRWTDKLKQLKTKATAASPDQAGSSTEPVQHGAAS